MNYNKKEIGNIVLHTIKTDRFKSIKVKVYFRREGIKEEISLISFLFSLMTYSTKNYDYIKLIEKREDLYNLKLTSKGVYEGDKYRYDTIGIKFLNPKYSYKNIEKDSLDLLYEVIFNPNLTNKEYFEEIKTFIKTENLSLKNNKREYAKTQLLKAMEPNSVASYPVLAYLEELDDINIEKINDFYNNYINTNQIDVFVVGDIDENFYEEYFKKIFNNSKRLEKTITPIYTNKPEEKEIYIEDKTLNQSKLEIGLRVINFDREKERKILALYITILGKGPHSKLFREVRENNSLAYYSNASVHNSSLLLIESGIDGKNYNKTVNVIKKQLNDMQFATEEELNIAKKTSISGLKDIEYSSSALMNFYYTNERDPYPVKNIEQVIEEINSVKIEDIREFSKKVFVDTILLYGVKDE